MSGFERSARMPPWIFGCSVLTRPPSISGEPVTSATSLCAIAGLGELCRRVAAGDELPPEIGQALREGTSPSLSYTDSKPSCVHALCPQLSAVIPSGTMARPASRSASARPITAG